MRLLFGMLLLFTFEMHAADALDKRLKAEQWDSYCKSKIRL